MIQVKRASEFCEECSMEGSTITVIRAVNNSFNDRLKAILAGTNTDSSPLDLGCPNVSLIDAGLPNFPIQVTVDRLLEKQCQTNHPFKLSDVAHFPEYLYRPIAVFRSATDPTGNSFVILTEMDCNGINIVVVINPNKFKGKGINSIRSIYPKDNTAAVLGWISAGYLLWCDKIKILNWIGKQQSIPADVTNLIKNCTKVIDSM